MNKDNFITPEDLSLFNKGTHFHLYEKLGSHPLLQEGVEGIHFAVWAPNAERVFLIGDFNGWDSRRCPLQSLEQSGLWSVFVPHLKEGTLYKYAVYSSHNHYQAEKADPFAFAAELAPRTASKIWNLDYCWKDQVWMKNRAEKNSLQAPLSIYEVHLGSWKRKAENQFLSYRELATHLTAYVKKMGFTHVEFLPLMEHPFYGSWGYQTTSYFAPTSRYGSPQDFMFLIDTLHQNDIGVILDWVPSHFPNDEHGLAFFDGTALFEHEDPRQGFHPDWKSCIFNYGRNEVKSFLINSALFWFDQYHVDGLRVDAVASMLHLDYSRKEGEWIPNVHGSNENLEAVSFLRSLNEVVYRFYPEVQMFAEESNSWPGVSRPTHLGGLGFGLKWDMGWMHDTLCYLSKDPVHRRYHHQDLTFRLLYAHQESFCLPLSHDEVVYGKGSLLSKMPGNAWQKLANLRLLLAYQYAQPGKKLLFMGGEFGQGKEWNHDEALQWQLLQELPHQGIQRWVQDLNRLYRAEKALHEFDCDSQGFEWMECDDAEQSVLSFIRKTQNPADSILAIFNFTPLPRFHYPLRVPKNGCWRELLNSDAQEYGGSGLGNLGEVKTESLLLSLTLPPLGCLFLKRNATAQVALEIARTAEQSLRKNTNGPPMSRG
ncbi:MAG: 1,4-alpha-glucan branching protein GlgB [Deltaproteobacteria bacterium]|nr:1,4-alpha-glucan branching protein GlgB [Deltaproteobacteria bacterium]